jgi:hypothetical protein
MSSVSRLKRQAEAPIRSALVGITYVILDHFLKAVPGIVVVVIFVESILIPFQGFHVEVVYHLKSFLRVMSHLQLGRSVGDFLQLHSPSPQV